MLELLLDKAIPAGVEIARDILKKRLTAINERQLEKKRVKSVADAFAEANEARKRQALPSLKLEEYLETKEAAELRASVVLLPAETLKAELDVRTQEVTAIIGNHIQLVEKWCTTTDYADNTNQLVQRVHVTLDTYLTPQRFHVDNAERSQRTPLLSTLRTQSGHAVILGTPGAGKTTSMKKAFLDLLAQKKATSSSPTPILLRLRELKQQRGKDHPILQAIEAIAPIQLTFGSTPADLEGSPDELLEKPLQLLAILDHINVFLILDGFDEISDPKIRELALADIKLIASFLKLSRMALTCRTGEFNYRLDNTCTFEIAPLTEHQIISFASHWLEDKNTIAAFVVAIRQSPFYDTAIRPLALAHLCSIYRRIGKIPDKPKTVYRKVVGLLLEEWDQQREVERRSEYGKFEADIKFEFLCHLSYVITTEYRTTSFDVSQLLSAYGVICENFELPQREAVEVVREIESHTGLLVQSGYDKYEFAHKSLQEYLAAEFIVRLPSVSPADEIKILPNELAIALSISSNSSLYLADLTLRVFPLSKPPREFFNAFLARLRIEKPNFVSHTLAVLAAYSLLTFHEHGGRLPTSRDSLPTREISSLPLFEEIFSDLFARNSTEMLLRHYKPVTSHPKGSTTYLRRVRELPGYQIPAFVIVPISILST